MRIAGPRDSRPTSGSRRTVRKAGAFATPSPAARPGQSSPPQTQTMDVASVLGLQGLQSAGEATERGDPDGWAATTLRWSRAALDDLASLQAALLRGEDLDHNLERLDALTRTAMAQPGASALDEISRAISLRVRVELAKYRRDGAGEAGAPKDHKSNQTLEVARGGDYTGGTRRRV